MLYPQTSTKPQVDHKAAAYVAPKKAPLTESNSNSLEDQGDGKEEQPVKPAAVKKAAAPSSRPRWGGAEICPRCSQSVSKALINSWI